MTEISASNRRNTLCNLQTKINSFVIRKRRNSTLSKNMPNSTSSIVSQLSFTCIPVLTKPDLSNVNFDTILKNATFLVEFRHFLKSELSQENLDFWIEVENYKNLKTKNKCKRLLEAKKIYRKFLAAGALSGRVRK